MAWRVFPRDRFLQDQDHAERDNFLNRTCCDVFNAASKEVLETKSKEVTFSRVLAEERVARAGRAAKGLTVVSSRFAAEFTGVFEIFAKVLCTGIKKAPVEECLHYTGQFYEGVCKMQSHLGAPPDNVEEKTDWTESDTLGIVIFRAAWKAVHKTHFLTPKEARIQKLVENSLSTFCRTIVLSLMRAAYAEDRVSQSRCIHYCFFLLRDIIEETLRMEEVEEEDGKDRRACCVV